MDEPSWKLDSHTLKPLTPPAHSTAAADEIDYQDYALVVTGDVFRWMIDYASFDTLQRASSYIYLESEPGADGTDGTTDAREGADIRPYVAR
jgi:hypothetical protein